MKSSITALVLLFILTCCNSKQEKTVTPVQPKVTEPVRIIAIGRVEPEVKITEIGSEVNGVIRKIYTHAGDTVKKGELLVEFAHDFEDAKLQQTTSKIAAQQAEIQNIQAQINSANIKAENLRVQNDRIQKTFAEGAETGQNADNAKASYLQSLKEIERLQAALRSAQSKVNEMGADTKVASVDIERRKVKAPADGVILTMDLTEGGAGTTEKPLFEFAPNSPLTVLCEVDEMWVNKLKLGQKAIIRTQGMDDNLAEGEVIFLGSYLKKKSLFSDDSGNMEDRRVREVRVRLTGKPDLLINSRVEVVINLQPTK